MMNPFIQNYGHIQAIKSLIDQRYHDLFISIVSFTKRCTFKMDELDYRQIGSNSLIVYDVELTEYINRKISVLKIQNTELLLNDTDIKNIYNKINGANILDNSIRESHIQYLKNDNNPSKENINKGKNQDVCLVCQRPVSEKVKEFYLSNKKFNGKIYCFEHQKGK